MNDRLTKTREAEIRLAQRRRRWLIRSSFVLVGIGLGYACSSVPASWQFFCHLTAKVFALLGGS